VEKSEYINLATIAMGKGYSYEEMKYGDYLYDKEDEIDGVWEYVEECRKIGSVAFKEKYSDYKFYPGF